MKKTIHYILTICSLSLLLILFSCSPQKQLEHARHKMERLIKNHPELLHKDSTSIDVCDTTAGIKKHFEVPFFFPQDTSANTLIKAVGKQQSQYDTVAIFPFAPVIIPQLKPKPYKAQFDTITKVDGDVTVKIYWLAGNKIGVDIYQPEKIKTTKVTKNLNSQFQNKCETAWYYTWAVWGFIISLIICVILSLILYLKK